MCFYLPSQNDSFEPSPSLYAVIKCVSSHQEVQIGILEMEVNQIKWVPENLYTFTIWPAIEKVYIFSGTHFIFSEIELIEQCSLGTILMFCMALFNLNEPL